MRLCMLPTKTFTRNVSEPLRCRVALAPSHPHAEQSVNAVRGAPSNSPQRRVAAAATARAAYVDDLSSYKSCSPKTSVQAASVSKKKTPTVDETSARKSRAKNIIQMTGSLQPSYVD